MNDIKLAYENKNFFEERPLRVLELCSVLTPIMNNLHSTSYSERFWIMVLGNYVHTSLNRTNYLMQEIYDYVIPLHEINSWKPLRRKEALKAMVIYFLRSIKSKGSINKFRKALKDSNDICFGPRGKELAEMGQGIYCESIMPLLFLGNNNKRKDLNKLALKEKDIFLKNLLLQVPRLYVEHLTLLLTLIPIVEDSKDKIFHMEHRGGVFMNLLLAVYSEFGSKIYQYQFGGYIGETQVSMSPVKYATIDKHFTYGWKIHVKDEPFYGVRLESFKNDYKKYLADLTVPNQDIIVIYDSLRNDKKIYHYKSVSAKFFSSIDYKKFQTITLRPRGISRKIDNSKELDCLNVPSNISVDKGRKPLAELIANSKIVIHWNHPSTNFLECIYVNHPVIAILTNTNPTDIIIPYYSFFLSVGVMHENVENLIIHLNKVDINVWWQQVIKMQKYLDFKDEFARNPKTF